VRFLSGSALLGFVDQLKECCPGLVETLGGDIIAALAAKCIQIDMRTYLTEDAAMKGSEFLKKLKTLAERKRWSYEWRADEGKGSHGALYVNGKKPSCVI